MNLLVPCPFTTLLTLTAQCPIEMFYSKHTHIHTYTNRIFRQSSFGELTLRGLKEKNKRLCVLWVKVEKIEEGCLYICVHVIGSRALIGCLQTELLVCHHAWRSQLSLSWNLWCSHYDGRNGWKVMPGGGVLTDAGRKASIHPSIYKLNIYILYTYIISYNNLLISLNYLYKSIGFFWIGSLWNDAWHYILCVNGRYYVVIRMMDSTL